MFNKFNQVFVMDDNSNIVVFNQPQNVPKPMFAVDSNGKLFPNKSGHDLFSFVIMRSKSGNYYFHSNITYCLPKEKGGIHMMGTFHPAALLRNPGNKPAALADFLGLREKIRQLCPEVYEL